MKNFEGSVLFLGLVIIFLIISGYLNDWEFLKDIWNLLQSLSQAISNFINNNN